MKGHFVTVTTDKMRFCFEVGIGDNGDHANVVPKAFSLSGGKVLKKRLRVYIN